MIFNTDELRSRWGIAVCYFLTVNDDYHGASHLDCCLLVIFVLGQAASPQHKITLVPVLDQTPLLFLEPAGLQGPLHGPGGAHGAGARVPLSWYHALGPGWNTTKLHLVKMSRKTRIPV